MVGAAPSFREVHLARTLLVLNAGKTGRKALVRILGVGEGSVRTIIKKLSKDGLIRSKPRGHELSVKGRRVVKGYLDAFTVPELVDLDIAPGKKCSLVVVRNAVDKVTTGVRERELAVKAGADGAILLKNSKDGFRFPCDDISMEDYPRTRTFLEGKNLSQRDLAVIGFSDAAEKAVDGALAIALALASKEA